MVSFCLLFCLLLWLQYIYQNEEVTMITNGVELESGYDIVK